VLGVLDAIQGLGRFDPGGDICDALEVAKGRDDGGPRT
jgi:hypothetical protein